LLNALPSVWLLLESIVEISLSIIGERHGLLKLLERGRIFWQWLTLEFVELSSLFVVLLSLLSLYFEWMMWFFGTVSSVARDSMIYVDFARAATDSMVVFYDIATTREILQ
jgi:hypothetical protein